MRCDYFRLCYIYAKGGFYVDADEVFQETDCNSFYQDNKLKLQPLCYDTGSQSMIRPDVFTIKDEPYQDWIFYVNNNPIIAPAYHPAIRLALIRATRILLHSKANRFDIQSITGPGNLSASLVMHSLILKNNGSPHDFIFLSDWVNTSICQWELEYRNDERNWRVWKKIISKSLNKPYSFETFVYLMQNKREHHE